MYKKLSAMPSFGDILFVMIFLLLLITIPTFIFSDGSTGWHLACGDYILNYGQIPTKDFFSYTMEGKNWIPYEWLSDLIMASLVKIGGLNLLAVFISTIISGLFLLLYNQLRKSGCHIFLSVIFITIGALASSIHWLARPHIFSYICIFILITVLEKFYAGAMTLKKMLIIILPVMIFYTNCHPSFLLGLGLILIYALSALLLGLINAQAVSRLKLLNLAFGFGVSGFVAFLMTFINPYGLKLYYYIFHYLKGSKILAATEEYGSPEFHGQLSSSCIQIILVFWLIGLCLSLKKISLPKFIVTMLFFNLMLTSIRFIPLFVICCLPDLGILYSNFTFGFIEQNLNNLYLKFRNYLITLDVSISEIEQICRMHILPILLIISFSVIALFNLKFKDKPILECHFNDKTMPTKTLDYIVNNHLPANQGFTYDNWGGYIYYKTHLKLFIDDRADFYGEKHYFQYAHISLVTKSWANDLAKLKISWVLFPKNAKLTEFLSIDPNWTLACKDDAGDLYIRK